jgi:spore coat protein U-like protein
LTFEPGCQISSLGPSAFGHCASLHSVCIPSSVETISNTCFNCCASVTIVLEEGSQLADESLSALRANGDITVVGCE